MPSVKMGKVLPVAFHSPVRVRQPAVGGDIDNHFHCVTLVTVTGCLFLPVFLGNVLLVTVLPNNKSQLFGCYRPVQNFGSISPQ